MSTDTPAASDDATPADAEASGAPRTRVSAPKKPKVPKNSEAPAALETAPTAEPEITPKPVVEPVPSNRSFWTRIERPFVFGFLVTLGGLTAILLGLALSNLSTVIIYIALALFAALGLDPAVRFLERRGLSRGGAS